VGRKPQYKEMTGEELRRGGGVFGVWGGGGWSECRTQEAENESF